MEVQGFGVSTRKIEVTRADVMTRVSLKARSPSLLYFYDHLKLRYIV